MLLAGEESKVCGGGWSSTLGDQCGIRRDKHEVADREEYGPLGHCGRGCMTSPPVTFRFGWSGGRRVAPDVVDRPSIVSYGFHRCMLSRWNCVQSPGEGLEVCACAGVLAETSISHSGAIASSKLTILNEAVCFLLVTEIGDFILVQPPEISCIGRDRRRRGGRWR